MSTNPPVTQRPTSVTVAIVIGWISVLIDLIGGLSLLSFAGNDAVVDALGRDPATMRIMGITTLLAGVVLAVVVFMLGQGSSVARTLVKIVMGLRIALALYGLIALGTAQLAEYLTTIAVAAFALWLLWNHSADRYFASDRPHAD